MKTEMSEAEKRLRDMMLVDDIQQSTTLLDALNALLAEERAKASAARDAALEETRDTFPDGGVYSGSTVRGILKAMQSAPAQVVPAAKVREVLSHYLGNTSTEEALRAMGVDLDAAPARHTTCGPGCMDYQSPAEQEAPREVGGATGAFLLYKEPECAGEPDCGWHNGGPCEPCKAKARVYDEPAYAPTPGTCKGCDAPEDAPRERHRMGCAVHNERLTLPATRDAAGGFRVTLPVELCDLDPLCSRFKGHPPPCKPTDKSE